MKNPYEVLGVDKNSTQEEIKKKYRQLAFEKHPDRNKDGKDDEFKEISSAYEILSDPTKKQQYDTTGSTSNTPRQNNPGFTSGFNNVNIEDMFSDIFGFKAQQHKKTAHGQDLHYNMQLTFIESVLGCVKPITISYPTECGYCVGSGAKNNTDKTQCSSCRGTGKISSFGGVINVIRTCHQCGGKGFVVINKCEHCNGVGTKSKSSTYNISIPPGIDNGISMRLHGKGLGAEYNVAPGDLYVTMFVDKHTQFEKNGNNIISDLKLDYVDAILGTRMEVDTIHGKTIITTPALLQSESILKVTGHGIYATDGKKGDHLFRIKLTIPASINEEEKQKLEEIKKGRK